MIIDIAKFIYDKWRRWKYKEDYDSDAKIKVDSKNQLIQYKLQNKETYAVYAWPNLLVTSIELWNTGEVISNKDKALILIDLLDYIYNYAGKKACIIINKNHPDQDYWEKQTARLKYKIESVTIFDEEAELQLYIDELSKVFESGQTIEVDGKVIDNRSDLEKFLREKQTTRNEK